MTAVCICTQSQQQVHTHFAKYLGITSHSDRFSFQDMDQRLSISPSNFKVLFYISITWVGFLEAKLIHSLGFQQQNNCLELIESHLEEERHEICVSARKPPS